MRIRPKPQSQDPGSVRALQTGIEPRALTDQERLDIFRRNYIKGDDPMKAQVLASTLANQALSDLYIFMADGNQLIIDVLIKAIRSKIQAWHLFRTDDELGALLKQARIYAIGHRPGDFENAIQIIPVVPTKYAQDLVARSRLPLACEFWCVIGPYGGLNLPADAIMIMQAVINTDLTITDRELGSSSPMEATDFDGKVFDRSVTRMVSCAYYEQALPFSLKGSPAIVLEEWNMGFIAPNQDSLKDAGPVIRAMALHYHELHERYEMEGRYWIALRDFSMGPGEAFATQQVINRPAGLSDGRTISFHVPGGYRSGYPDAVAWLIDNVKFWERQKRNTSFLDVGLLREYNQLDPQPEA